MHSRKVCTVRGKHEIYGDERIRLTNNKSKGSKAQTPSDFTFWLRRVGRELVFAVEIVVVSSVFGQKFFSVEKPRVACTLGRSKDTHFQHKHKGSRRFSVRKPMKVEL